MGRQAELQALEMYWVPPDLREHGGEVDITALGERCPELTVARNHQEHIIFLASAAFVQQLEENPYMLYRRARSFETEQSSARIIPLDQPKQPALEVPSWQPAAAVAL